MTSVELEPTAADPRTWCCTACDVSWHGTDQSCWICGELGLRGFEYSQTLISGLADVASHQHDPEN